MSRTDLNATTLARSLRMMAGDGSMEWVMEPIQARVLLDVADMLDENAELRVSYDTLKRMATEQLTVYAEHEQSWRDENAELRELVRALLPCYLWSDCYGETCQVADTPRCPRPSRLLERARELGVEVDA